MPGSLQTRLLERHTVAERTMAFRLEKPAGFSFKAGQNVDLGLIDPPQTAARRSDSGAAPPRLPLVGSLSSPPPDEGRTDSGAGHCSPATGRDLVGNTAPRPALSLRPEATRTSPQTDAEGNIRTFSLAGDPHDGTLLVATRLRDTAFKRVFETMPLGAALTLDGPHGDLTLPNRAVRTVVLLAGGIGITPFRPMALQAAREKLPHRIVLFYGNRRPEDAPFLDELLALQQQNPRYACVAIMSEMEKSRLSWDGPRGLIDAALLAQHLEGAAEPIFFIAGPPGMVGALKTMLNRSGVDDDDIRAEEFAGY